MAYVISDDCIACGTLVSMNARLEQSQKVINIQSIRTLCTECGTCADVCPF